jgi:heme-binding uptake protein ChaN (Tiki superfamily)
MSTSAIRIRRRAGELHALAGVQREIRATDSHARCKYVREYTDSFRNYQSVLQPEELHGILLQSDILLVGDYHALAACQRYTAEVIEDLAKATDRPIVLMLEAVLARDQMILEEWMQKEMDEEELRRRLRFDRDWGYEWEPFYELLCAARQHGAGVYGLDCLPRNDLRRIGLRDRHAAEKILEVRRQHPKALIIALIGESHLAPDHLPLRVSEKLPEDRIVTLLQNVDALYFRATGEPGDPPAAVRVSDDVVCVFNSTPLEKYESYRLSLERWKVEENAEPDLSPTIYNLIQGLGRFLHIDSYSSHNGTQPRFLVDQLPQVCYPASDEEIRALFSRKGAEAEVNDVLERLESRGCLYLPEHGLMAVRRLEIANAAEEAARFLHDACREVQPFDGSVDPEDVFFAIVLESALAYFGSSVLYPVRPLLESASEDSLETSLLGNFLAKNPTLDITSHGRCKTAAFDLPRNGSRESISRDLGYYLGRALYNAYLNGRISKRYVRSLFFLKLHSSGEAQQACLALVRKLRVCKKSCVVR